MRWRDFFDAELHVASADDAPWVFPSLELTEDVGRPFDQIAGGMDGRGRANPETPPWALEQLVTPSQVLPSLTIDAAYALNDDANRGHLAPGAYADITVLGRDITLAPRTRSGQPRDRDDRRWPRGLLRSRGILP